LEAERGNNKLPGVALLLRGGGEGLQRAVASGDVVKRGALLRRGGGAEEEEEEEEEAGNAMRTGNMN
jgi:hypothetical protein